MDTNWSISTISMGKKGKHSAAARKGLTNGDGVTAVPPKNAKKLASWFAKMGIPAVGRARWEKGE